MLEIRCLLLRVSTWEFSIAVGPDLRRSARRAPTRHPLEGQPRTGDADGTGCAVRISLTGVLKLAHTVEAADDTAPLDLLVTVTFQPDGTGTLLELIDTGHSTTEIRDAHLRNGADQGLAFYERTLP